MGNEPITEHGVAPPPLTPTRLAIYPPVADEGDYYIMANLIERFPKTAAAWDGGTDDGHGNHDIAAKLAERLAADHPEVAERVEFDPEYSGTYAYGKPADLAVVIEVIEALTAEGWAA